ncbi:hypothetical protein DSO57_1006765 [Entomophthora muscae]|uniref:Uncharacterized protein n=1 Tax=Entomophthora muscae TaxID=34485 RepID=A0ACC2S9N6_9FUNG|nr:hypothetical protein DSO57_1006765 [Entomophthora muscae]
MVLTTGAASPLVTLFPRAFSGPSPFVSEVPELSQVTNSYQLCLSKSPNYETQTLASRGPLARRASCPAPAVFWAQIRTGFDFRKSF